MSTEARREMQETERDRVEGKRCRVAVCAAAGCLSNGGQAVRAALEKTVKDEGAADEVEVFGTGCLGLCDAGPLVQVQRDGETRLYEKVDPATAARIAKDDAVSGTPARDLLPGGNDAFFARQRKIVLENSGRIDPERIESCVAEGAYEALQKAVTEMTPLDVIQQITASGLRGRGGGGYPTGLKWSTVYKAKGTRKFVICNADEGDPGAFMDRSVLEGDPHRVLEGMAIAAFAVGADQGYVYVRGEYPLAIQRLKTAIKQAEKAQFLGGRVLDTGFSFRVDIRIGAGAFVCGEETALIASIEGNRGTPRPRPPYPAMSGLWGHPTLINNVETFANIAPIVKNGGAWYASIGTEKSKGTKVFALAGKIARTGLVEVPMGVPLREIIFDIGGGIPGGRKFKAAQTGGPSGGCIPAQYLDLPVDYESLAGVGSIMGSGGLIVMDETSCMVDVAKYFMEFCRDESCGKCIPCRAGTVQMWGLLDKITRGEATRRDLDLLEHLADLLQEHEPVRPRPDGAEPRGLAPCATSATSTWRTSTSGGARPGSARSLPRGGGAPVSVKTFTLNGELVSAGEDQTILDVCDEQKVPIPRLCHLEGLGEIGACRLCMVEIQGWTKLAPSCMTRVEEGMVVTTSSERLQSYRRSIVELLFAERNHVCAICVVNGYCELQNLGYAVGMDHVRFEYQTPALQIDASHKRFALDNNRCVLCQRCVRVCDEVEGAHTWDVKGRGASAQVITDLDAPWGQSQSCTSCGKCVQVCPTGALFEKIRPKAEMVKNRDFLVYLTTAREKKLWIR